MESDDAPNKKVMELWRSSTTQTATTTTTTTHSKCGLKQGATSAPVSGTSNISGTSKRGKATVAAALGVKATAAPVVGVVPLVEPINSRRHHQISGNEKVKEEVPNRIGGGSNNGGGGDCSKHPIRSRTTSNNISNSDINATSKSDELKYLHKKFKRIASVVAPAATGDGAVADETGDDYSNNKTTILGGGGGGGGLSLSGGAIAGLGDDSAAPSSSTSIPDSEVSHSRNARSVDISTRTESSSSSSSDSRRPNIVTSSPFSIDGGNQQQQQQHVAPSEVESAEGRCHNNNNTNSNSSTSIDKALIVHHQQPQQYSNRINSAEGDQKKQEDQQRELQTEQQQQHQPQLILSQTHINNSAGIIGRVSNELEVNSRIGGAAAISLPSTASSIPEEECNNSTLRTTTTTSAVNNNGAGRHICPYCNLNCTKPSVLEKHIRSHTNERPYPCVTCGGLAFKTKSNLYKHRRSRAHQLRVQGTKLLPGQADDDLSLGSEHDLSSSGGTSGSEEVS